MYPTYPKEFHTWREIIHKISTFFERVIHRI